MGADGGMAWANIYCDYSIVTKLLGPLGLLGVTKHSDVGEDANSEWLKNKHLGYDVITCPYGTDCGGNNGLLDIPDVINDIEIAIKDGLETFADVLLDIDTQPGWYKVLVTYVSDGSLYDRLRDQREYSTIPDDFLEMPLKTWIADVRRFIGPVRSEETWT